MDLIGKKFLYKKTGLRYEVIDVIPYKDENTKSEWIEAVVYKPLYICPIPKFIRSKTMFLDLFIEDDNQA
jgi:hypothetical protein